MHRLWLLPFCVMLLGALCPESHADATTDRVEAYLKGRMAQDHIPAVSVAVVRDGKIVLLKSYGVANLEWNQPATSETLYQMASATKPLVGTALMLLVEDGKIHLDDPVSHYLPDAPAAWKDITIRHLATHSSGLKNFDVGTNWDSVEQAVKASANLPLEYAPGEKSQYGSSDAIVLMHIVEKVTGKSFPDFLRDRLFAPLGMTATRFSNATQSDAVRTADIVPQRASTYYWQEGRQYSSEFLYPTWTYAAGGLYSSVADLAKWVIALDKGKLLKPTSLDAMWSSFRLKDGAESGFGVCWVVERYRDRRTVGHSGGPALADILRFPDEKLTVIVLTNQRHLNPTLAKGVADILLGGAK